ncbi:MAG: DUF2785 domain-containing protein [Anaerolineaceae bacterium]|nr:DUF2785 domain-containing protein [Anaerolineaceae bacterium]
MAGRGELSHLLSCDLNRPYMFSDIQQIFKDKGTKIIDEPNFGEMFPALMENLGNIDSDTREGSLDMLWEIIESGDLSDKQLISMGNQLAKNLVVSVGEQGNDSVLLRSFSVLLLGVIIGHDETRKEKQGEVFLSLETFLIWFEKCKNYVLAEKDFRGFVPGKGWAHATSHGADVLRNFAFHHLSTPEDHVEILDILSEKLLENTEAIYINNDDNRLARVVVTILLRNQLKLADYEKWLDELLAKFDGQSWVNFADDRQKLIPWFNTITFLRALYFVLVHGMKVLEEVTLYEQVPVLREEVMALVQNMLKQMDQGLNYRAL